MLFSKLVTSLRHSLGRDDGRLMSSRPQTPGFAYSKPQQQQHQQQPKHKSSNLSQTVLENQAQQQQQQQDGATRKDRLLSCPDRHHHAESEMLLGMERILEQMMRNEKLSRNIELDASMQTWVDSFTATIPPPISLVSYLSRLVFYLGNIPEYSSDKAMHSDLAIRYMLGAILYIERIQDQVPGFELTVMNIHRLLITGVLITAKVLDDVQPDHKYYAQLGGVTVAELSKLEIAFLHLCDYNVNIDPIEFSEKYAISLMQRDRGFTDEDALYVRAILSPKIHRAPPPSLEDII